MDDREAAMIEATLERLRLGDSLLELAAMMATYAVRETGRQCAESQRCARIAGALEALEAEPSQRAADALETAT